VPEFTRRSGSRTITALLAATTAAILTLGLAGPAAALSTPRASYPKAIERLSSYQPQKTCSPWAKPGVVDLSKRLLRRYPTTRSLGIVRACSVGGTSEHKEGRAFDWGGLSAHRAIDRQRVANFTHWLFANDKYGHRYAMARRLGVMYLIWNHRIWSAYRAGEGWRRYSGSNPHTDHMHISMDWRGARKETSFWTGKVGSGSGTPTPTPSPSPSPFPAPGSGSDDPRPEPTPPASLPDGPALTTETLSLPADRVWGRYTTGELVAGTPYLIEVHGTYGYSSKSGARADAECSRTTTSGWARDRSINPAQPWSDHLDVYVDGHDLYSDPDTNNGSNCDTRTHTYRWTYTPSRTGRAPFRIWDPNQFANNSGALTVRVIRATARDDMTWRVGAAAGQGVTSPGALQGGATYEATVTGTVDDGDHVASDAECSKPTWDDTWSRTAGQDWSRYDVLLDKSDVRLDPVGTDQNGCDPQTHTYRTLISVGTTRPVNLRVNDPAFHDNSGHLTIHVVRVTPVTGPETLTLDSTSSAGTSSQRIYPAGQALRVHASGRYRFSSDIAADAECTSASWDPTWRVVRQGLSDGDRPLGDVTVNGQLLSWSPTSGSSSGCDPDHGYWVTFTPSGTGPIALALADTAFDDNSGSLTVTIEPAG
jgi:hypothetical protein